MRRRRLLQSWTLQQCWEDNLKHGTGGWSRSGHTDGLIKHFSLTKQKYCADRSKGDWVTIGQSSSQEQTHGLECLSWSNEDCVLLLMYKKPWWVSTPWSACRSVMVAEKTFWCWLFVWFFLCACGCVTDSSRGHWPRRRFISFPWQFVDYTAQYIMLRCMWTEPLKNKACPFAICC